MVQLRTVKRTVKLWKKKKKKSILSVAAPGAMPKGDNDAADAMTAATDNSAAASAFCIALNCFAFFSALGCAVCIVLAFFILEKFHPSSNRSHFKWRQRESERKSMSAVGCCGGAR